MGAAPDHHLEELAQARKDIKAVRNWARKKDQQLAKLEAELRDLGIGFETQPTQPSGAQEE